jgi:hypothetical protein
LWTLGSHTLGFSTVSEFCYLWIAAFNAYIEATKAFIRAFLDHFIINVEVRSSVRGRLRQILDLQAELLWVAIKTLADNVYQQALERYLIRSLISVFDFACVARLFEDELISIASESEECVRELES